MGRMTLRSRLELSHRLFGELDCTVVAPAGGRTPEFAVVLCHGFGAPGTDLVGLAQELAELTPDSAAETAYLFPEGPLDMGGYGFPGRAWWMVDVERFQRAAGNPREMAAIRAEVPDGMPEASTLLRGCLLAAERELGVPMSRTLLGGFSQGSMVATDVTLRAYGLAEELRGAVERLGRSISNGVEQVSRELSQVREAADRLRLLPASAIFSPLERAARDAAEVLGKRMVFGASGGEGRLDAHVLSALRDALLHVVRNAVAHGIESEAERAVAGKPGAGHVQLVVERRDAVGGMSRRVPLPADPRAPSFPGVPSFKATV